MEFSQGFKGVFPSLVGVFAVAQLRPMAAPVSFSILCTQLFVGLVVITDGAKPRCRRIFGLWSWKPAMYQRSRGHPVLVDALMEGPSLGVCYISNHHFLEMMMAPFLTSFLKNDTALNDHLHGFFSLCTKAAPKRTRGFHMFCDIG